MAQAAEPDLSPVPGTVVIHSPASSKVYIGSPGIAILKDGVYLTKYDDGLGGAHNAHDANFLTFHRFAGFRSLTMADSVIDPDKMEPGSKTEIKTADVTVEGYRFSSNTQPSLSGQSTG